MMFQFFCFSNPQTVLDEHVVVMMPWKSLWLFDMNFWQVLASSYIPRKKKVEKSSLMKLSNSESFSIRHVIRLGAIFLDWSFSFATFGQSVLLFS